MATINGVEVIGDKTAHDFGLLDNQDRTEIDNGIERNREATEDNHADIVRHRTDTDVLVTPAWKNSVVHRETLGAYWTAAQTADIINEISIAGGAKLVKVDALPATGLEQTIYLVPKTDPQAGDIFNEYVWIDGKFEFIGTTKADLSGYFPITGGALTGNIIERNTDSDHLGISGSYWGHGAYLWLSGQNSGYAGSWYLSARDTEKSCDLIGSPAGVLSWGGKLVLTEDDISNVVKYTDYATSTKGGVIKTSTSHGITMSADGFLMGATRTAEQYASNSGNMLINKGTLENVLTSKAETWEFTLSDGSTVTKKIVMA